MLCSAVVVFLYKKIKKRGNKLYVEEKSGGEGLNVKTRKKTRGNVVGNFMFIC